MRRVLRALAVVALLPVAGLLLSHVGRAGAQGTAASVSSWKASEAFAKGPLLLDRMASNRYQMFAVRRDAPGSVEHHALDTDIIMVLDGAATFVTEGVITEPRPLRANEQTGSGIRDGKARRVARGDVIVVPNGTASLVQRGQSGDPLLCGEASPGQRGRPGAVTRGVPGQDPKRSRRAACCSRAPTVRSSGSTRSVVTNRSASNCTTSTRIWCSSWAAAGNFLTGGSISAPRPLGPNESTGESVTGGTPSLLEAGDVLAIPAGTPHWLREVRGPIEFFAVKVR